MNGQDWKALREAFFRECVDIRSTPYGKEADVNIAPHDLFEWVKRQIQTKTGVVDDAVTTSNL